MLINTRTLFAALITTCVIGVSSTVTAFLPIQVAHAQLNPDIRQQLGDAVVVAPFTCRTNGSIPTSLQDGLSTSIARTLSEQGVRALERQGLKAISNEIDLAYMGIVDPTTAAQSGKMIGAKYILMGDVTFDIKQRSDGGLFKKVLKVDLGYQEMEFKIKLDAYLVRVETGEIISLKKVDAKKCQKGVLHRGRAVTSTADIFEDGGISSEEFAAGPLGEAAKEATRKIAEELQGSIVPPGNVLGVFSDGSVAIDLKMGQVKKGDRFQMVRAGESIGGIENVTIIGEAEAVDVQASGTKVKVTLNNPDVKPQQGDKLRRMSSARRGR